MTAAQVPGLVGRLHASHWPLQAWLQHTPSAQKPVAHSSLMPQPAPGGRRGMQLVPSQ